MYEYAGWFSISDDTYESNEERLAIAIGVIEEHLPTVQGTNELAILKSHNWATHLLIAGNHNHQRDTEDRIMEFLRVVAGVAPGSYGLLYVWDAEDPSGHDNEFRVWVMRRGELAERDDPFLSPCIPRIEDPEPETPDDADRS